MSASVKIRRGLRSDRSALLTFHRDLYVRYREALMEPGIAELYAYRDLDAALRDDVEAMLHNPLSVVLIAERDGEPVGYITGHIETDDRRVHPTKGVVGDWLVQSELRGEGVGRKLMEALLQAFADLGASVVESSTWPFNQLARDAHERSGFREIEVRYRRVLRPAAPGK